MTDNLDLLDSMIKEAIEEVANHGWKNASQNAVTLAAIGMMANKLNSRIGSIVKPAWIIAISVTGSAIWFMISSALGL